MDGDAVRGEQVVGEVQGREFGGVGAGAGLLGQVAVECLDLAGYFGTGDDDEVGAEQFHEHLMMPGKDAVGLGQFGGIAEDRFGVAHRLFGGGRQHLVADSGGEGGRVARDHPVLAGPHQPAHQDHAFLQRLERPAAQVGPGPVGELVQEVEQHQRVAVLAGDIKDTLDDVPPAQQHVPIGVGQLGMGRGERFDHRPS